MDENHASGPDDVPTAESSNDSLDHSLDAAAAAEGLLDDILANAFALPDDVQALDEDFDSPDDPNDSGLESDDVVDAGSARIRQGADYAQRSPGLAGLSLPLRPMNLNLLTSLEASLYWRDLDAWVTWLRRDYGLGVTVIPPLWHRHAELRWELSALHTSWLASYDPEASASAPITWHRELAEAQIRLAEWVSRSGTGLTEDRPTQITLWPGETGFGSQETWDSEAVRPRPVTDRGADFEAWVDQDMTARRETENRVRSRLRSPMHDDMPLHRTRSGMS